MLTKIAFELVVFFLLCIQMYHLISQFALPGLRKQIAALYKRWKDLQDKLNLSLATKKRINKEIKKEIAAFDTLEEKIQQWHTVLKEKKKAHEKRQIEVAHTLHEKKKTQLSRLQILKAKQEVVPKAVTHARELLEKEYAGDKGKTLITKVLNELGSQ